MYITAQTAVRASMRGCFSKTYAKQRLNALSNLRKYSTPAGAADLPLKGFRVLDMTRVLAGVSHFSQLIQNTTNANVLFYSPTAHRF